MTAASARERIRSIRKGFEKDKLLLLSQMDLHDDRNQYALKVLRELLNTLEYAGDVISIVLHANWNTLPFSYFSLGEDRKMAEMGLEYLQKALDLIQRHKEIFNEEGINLLEFIKKYPDL